MIIVVILIVFAFVIILIGGNNPDAVKLYYEADFAELYNEDKKSEKIKTPGKVDANQIEDEEVQQGTVKSDSSTKVSLSKESSIDYSKQVAKDIYEDFNIELDS